MRMLQPNYLMESEAETLRLDLKTNRSTLSKQAKWAGIKPKMRVADLGCGPGKTSYYLSELVGPQGEVIGIDYSPNRIEYAKQHYPGANIQYECLDIRESMAHLNKFDFVWVRFVLEYYGSSGFDLIQNIKKIIKPNGILCLIDLDHNCLNHFGISNRLEKAVQKAVSILQQYSDFDPYAGRKLYTYMYDANFQDLDVMLMPHHLLFGILREIDNLNWTQKGEIALKRSGYQFDDYPGGYDEFYDDFKQAFNDPRRFTYTPLIACRGRMPVNHH